MTPFGESHRYQEQIGAFLLGELDNSCERHFRASRIQVCLPS